MTTELLDFSYGNTEHDLSRVMKSMKLNVLVVDDSTVIRKMLKRVLTESNLPFDKIYEAGDGRQALGALDADTVHLVLCDVNMPVMDGLEFLETVRSNPAWQSLPVLMVTTEGGEASVRRAAQLGAKGYIRKPFTTEEVKDKLTTCIQSSYPSGR
ncbi:MAG TPA: response regulator [Acidobacteriaceae bacterium]|jgi:two-component system chemotaxis response regulator CheY